MVFDGARVPAANMIGKPGEGWRIAMTIVSHEREPGEVGYVARYVKTVKDLEVTVRAKPGAFQSDQHEAVAWAHVQAEMLRLHVRRRLSERLDGVDHGPDGSIDKILMTWVEQAVGTAALSVAGSHAVVDGDDLLEPIANGVTGAEDHVLAALRDHGLERVGPVAKIMLQAFDGPRTHARAGLRIDDENPLHGCDPAK